MGTRVGMLVEFHELRVATVSVFRNDGQLAFSAEV